MSFEHYICEIDACYQQVRNVSTILELEAGYVTILSVV
jgi:hypothetical protein